MLRPYDIFRKDAYGQPEWLEAVENPESAKLRVIELGARAPGQYLVFCRHTGHLVSTMTSVANPGACATERNKHGGREQFAAPESQYQTAF